MASVVRATLDVYCLLRVCYPPSPQPLRPLCGRVQVFLVTVTPGPCTPQLLVGTQHHAEWDPVDLLSHFVMFSFF